MHIVDILRQYNLLQMIFFFQIITYLKQKQHHVFRIKKYIFPNIEYRCSLVSENKTEIRISGIYVK